LILSENQELNKMDLLNKISEFNGKPENWNKWSKPFLAKASLRGYKRIIQNQEPYPAEDDMKSWQELKIRNDLGYAELLLSCQDDVCFNIIDNAKSVKFPEGDLYLAWHMLEQRFEPKTSSRLVSLRKEFNLCALKNVNQDPEEWINELEILRRKLEALNHQMTDLDMIIHILNNLPSEYESVIESLETDLDDDLLVDLEKVRAKLRAKYLRIQRYQEEKPSSRGERALIMKDKTQFKGNCRLCGEYGHKAMFCKKREDKSKAICNYCKKLDTWRKIASEKQDTIKGKVRTQTTKEALKF
jgi:hypothetical protein